MCIALVASGIVFENTDKNLRRHLGRRPDRTGEGNQTSDESKASHNESLIGRLKDDAQPFCSNGMLNPEPGRGHCTFRRKRTDTCGSSGPVSTATQSSAWKPRAQGRVRRSSRSCACCDDNPKLRFPAVANRSAEPHVSGRFPRTYGSPPEGGHYVQPLERGRITVPTSSAVPSSATAHK